MPTTVLAERAGIARQTLHKIERGDPSVSMGGYAAVAFSLGLLPSLAGVASIRDDLVGLSLDEERLPHRIRLRTRQPSSSGD